jgi:hypothetical protein
MKNGLNKWCTLLTLALTWVALCSGTPVARAADEPSGREGDRMQRLEQRLNQLAERQEQMLQRLGAPQQQPPTGQMNPRRDRAQLMGRPELNPARPPFAGPGLPNPGMPNPDMAKAHKGLHDLIGLIFLVAIICNILLAMWIFTDIRKRGEGSGIFIALALVAGIPTAIIYALVRIGDRKPAA